MELVFFGAEPDESGGAELIEVHIYVSGGWVVTIRKDECSALDELRQEIEQSPPQAESVVVARILDALANTFDDLLDPLDDELSSIEQQVFESGGRSRVTRELRRDILEHRRSLFRKRRLVRRQRDYIERTISEIEDLPGLEPSQRHDLRDVSGQMIRVNDRVDDALDRLAAALDLLSSTVSNRLNAIMERLTVVATIFLPLTFLTGFFGMNFAWLVKEIDTPLAFWTLGVGLVLAARAWASRSGWPGGSSAARSTTRPVRTSIFSCGVPAAPHSPSHRGRYISCPRAAPIAPRSITRSAGQPKLPSSSVTSRLAASSLPETNIVWSPGTASGVTITPR